MNSYGFIGVGNMGSAIVRALCKRVPAQQVLLSNRTPEKAIALAKELGCISAENRTVATQAHFLFLGVKPQYMEALLAELRPTLEARSDRFVLISMAAGLDIPELRTRGCGSWPVIRIMPNTPAAVGEGVVFYTTDGVSQEEEALFLEAMQGAGRLLPLDDQLIDAGTAIVGCGPAFAALFMEALADGGVACGLSRPLALECAAQLLVGTGQLLLQTGSHPGQLKDAVCSPGGSTIQGVRALEEAGFRGAVMDAVITAFQQSAKLKEIQH